MLQYIIFSFNFQRRYDIEQGDNRQNDANSITIHTEIHKFYRVGPSWPNRTGSTESFKLFSLSLVSKLISYRAYAAQLSAILLNVVAAFSTADGKNRTTDLLILWR